MVAQTQTLDSYVSSLFESGMGKEEVITHMMERGHEATSVADIVGEVAKQRYAARRSSGLNLILAGGVICFLSFLLTITSAFSHEAFPYVLYGLTSIGIGIGFVGLTKVF